MQRSVDLYTVLYLWKGFIDTCQCCTAYCITKFVLSGKCIRDLSKVPLSRDRCFEVNRHSIVDPDRALMSSVCQLSPFIEVLDCFNEWGITLAGISTQTPIWNRCSSSKYRLLTFRTIKETSRLFRPIQIFYLAPRTLAADSLETIINVHGYNLYMVQWRIYHWTNDRPTFVPGPPKE